MRKLAVFVEGYSELLFVDKLFEHVAGTHNVSIEHRNIRGGSTVPRRSTMLKAGNVAVPAQKYFVLIFDCGSDEQVKTRIMEEHPTLTAAGYEHIIGIRDVRPRFELHEVPKLRSGLRTAIKTKLAPVTFVLSVMEFETWLLAESTHFQRIDPAITLAAVQAAIGCDVSTGDLSTRQDPAADLRTCYQLAGKQYAKGDPVSIGALDFAEVYLNLPARISDVAALVAQVDAFLT